MTNLVFRNFLNVSLKVLYNFPIYCKCIRDVQEEKTTRNRHQCNTESDSQSGGIP